MSTATAPKNAYSAEAFLDAAEKAIATAGADVSGDHILNPDFALERVAYKDAAVLIPVVAYQPEASVILTVRTGHLSSHAGQIAFPGGKIDPGDATPAAAALREAECAALLRELERMRWNISRTAQTLGISRNTLYRKIHKHKIMLEH